MKFTMVFQEELDALRVKFEKAEKERQELKQTNEKLESRVSFSLFLWYYCQVRQEFIKLVITLMLIELYVGSGTNGGLGIFVTLYKATF